METIPYSVYTDIFEYIDSTELFAYLSVNTFFYKAIEYRYRYLKEYVGINTSNRKLLPILKKTRSLVSLKLDRCFLLNSTFFFNISNYIGLLEEVVLTNIYYITNECIITLTQYAPKLHSINLNNCKNLSNVAIIALANNCENIYRVSCMNCNKINNTGIIYLTNKRIIGYLNVGLCSKITSNCFLQSNILYLKYLNIDFCYKILDYAVNYILKTSIYLEYLNISNCDNISDNAFLNTKCHNLQILFIQRMQHITLNTIRHMTNLRYLNLYSLHNLSENAFIRLLELNPNLTELNIKFCNSISKRTLDTLCKYNLKLTRLNISYCHNIIYINIDILLKYLKELKTLVINYGIYIEFYVINYNIKIPNILEELVLNNCNKMTSYYIIDLLQKCTNLKYLSLHGTKRITNPVINTIIKYNSDKLEILDLTNCKYIQNYQLKKLLSNCTKLKKLFIGNVFNYNIHTLKTLFPQVDIC